MKINFKTYLPHALAIVVFVIVTLVYFKPLLSGKVLRQDDIARHKGMSKEILDYRNQHNEEPLWTNSMFGGMPAYQISTLYSGNWLGKLDEVFKLFLPRPSGYLFLYCLGFFILLLCLEVNPWLALVGGLDYGFISYFLIIIEAGHNSKANALGYLPALIGGIILLYRGKTGLGLALTTLFTALELNANHVQISYYGYILIGFIVLGYFIEAFKNKTISSFAKATGLLILATIIGVLPNAGSLSMTNEYGKYSTRGQTELTIKASIKKNKALDDEDNSTKSELITEETKEQYQKNTTSGLDANYATQWSYGIGETFTFLIPDFKGGASSTIRNADPEALKKVNPEYREQVASNNSYFGNQPFTSGPVYIGALVVFLAFLGMFVVKHSIKWPLFFATILTVALGWGSNFMPLTDFFMHYVPGYNKFRAVSMIMIVAELTLPILAIMAVNELLKVKSWEQKLNLFLINKEVSLKKLIIISASVVGGFCLLNYVAPDLFNTFLAENEDQIMINEAVRAGNPADQVRAYVMELMPQLEIARKAIFKSDAFRSFVFILLGMLAIYLYFTNKIKREYLMLSLGIFILVDLWTVDQRYLNSRSFITKEQNEQSVVAKTSADDEILKDTDPNYRVLNLSTSTWNDAQTSFYHKSVGGYHGAKLKKYQELIDFSLDREISFFYKNGNSIFSGDSARNALMAKLHTLNMLNTKYIILPGGEGREEIALKNPQANGNAWLVKNVFAVPSADDEILGLRKIDTKTQAITTEKQKIAVTAKDSYSGEGSIKLLSYSPNKLTYASDTKSDEFAVFSEIYYPKGWNAYIDGSVQPHIPVNYVLRGLPVPAGKHTIEFKFEPETYASSNKMAMIGSILMFLTIGFGMYLHKKGNNVIVS